MNQNEFRIGNYVTDSKTGKVVTVDGIQFTGRIVTHDESYDDWKRGIEPVGIPLTPEILEKAGFVWKDRTKHWFITFTRDGDDPDSMTLFIGKEEPFYWWGLQNKIFDTIAVQSIYHLHQLQNLYFALTGEELPIEL